VVSCDVIQSGGPGIPGPRNTMPHSRGLVPLLDYNAGVAGLNDSPPVILDYVYGIATNKFRKASSVCEA